jgi:hypothetical protein
MISLPPGRRFRAIFDGSEDMGWAMAAPSL